MYHVVVKDKEEVIAEALLEGLAEAVSFGTEEGEKTNLIVIYEALQDASGDIIHICKVLSAVILDVKPQVDT